jgi:hypothetical protein
MKNEIVIENGQSLKLHQMQQVMFASSFVLTPTPNARPFGPYCPLMGPWEMHRSRERREGEGSDKMERQ